MVPPINFKLVLPAYCNVLDVAPSIVSLPALLIVISPVDLVTIISSLPFVLVGNVRVCVEEPVKMIMCSVDPITVVPPVVTISVTFLDTADSVLKAADTDVPVLFNVICAPPLPYMYNGCELKQPISPIVPFTVTAHVVVSLIVATVAFPAPDTSQRVLPFTHTSPPTDNFDVFPGETSDNTGSASPIKVLPLLVLTVKTLPFAFKNLVTP